MMKRIYSTGEVARRLGLKRYQLHYMLETDQITEPLLRIAGRRAWTREELDRVASVVYEREKRWAWLKADLRDAFHSLPHGRLLQVLSMHIFNEEMLDTLERCVRRNGTRLKGLKRDRGVPQACPLSPFFLNAYLSHFYDRPWKEKHPELPFIRYADDLLLPCRSMSELEGAERQLGKIIQPHGLRIRKEKTRRADLNENEALSYMGFTIKLISGRIHIEINESLWNNLAHRLRHAAASAEDPVVKSNKANDVIVGWLNYLGPALHHMKREERADIVNQTHHIAEMTHIDTKQLGGVNEQYARMERAARQWGQIREETQRRIPEWEETTKR